MKAIITLDLQASLQHWIADAPALTGAVDADAKILAGHISGGEKILGTLPVKAERSSPLQSIAQDVHRLCRAMRTDFMIRHPEWIYECLTRGRAPQRLSDLAFAAADCFPGLVPTREQIAQERCLRQGDKEGVEIDQGIFFWGLLRSSKVGSHLIESMLRPTLRAQELLVEFRHSGRLELKTVLIERINHAAHLTIHNEASLNAEDDGLIDDMETAVDLALLDDQVGVGILRGGMMTHPRYIGRRVFSAGVNLKHLHRGQISFVDFLLRREFGYINKFLRGLLIDDPKDAVEKTVQKPWIGVVDTFAIGGGAQLLLAFDHVIAGNDSYFSLPAAQEGIVPGAANLRLHRMVGGRMARQIILSGRKVWASEPDARFLFDEVVPASEIDAAIESAIAKLDSPAVIANRGMLMLAEEPIDTFREYMAEFALQQAYRLYSPDVLAKIFH